jgi:pimeloyl-ACP methyl ester carboxylesterase
VAQTVRLADGALVAFAEYGALDGLPVFAFHGIPGSRLQRHPDESIARDAGLRMLHVDRPGYGLSTPQPHRTLADWPRTIAALADALGLARFAIVGISGGGPYAAACAAMLGERVIRAAIISSVGPPGAMRGRMPLAARLAFALAPHMRWLMKLPVALGARLARRAPQRFINAVARRLSPADRATLARPEMQAMLAEDLREALRQGVEAIGTDIGLLARPWQLPWERVSCPVALWHGEDDWLVPPGATRYLAQAIPQARTQLVPHAGHFFVIESWPEICRWLAASESSTLAAL